jgi:hypothetical protein
LRTLRLLGFHHLAGAGAGGARGVVLHRAT